MEIGLAAFALSFGAGLASVASPCVLPVVPILVAGASDEHRSRPALVVSGIALSFVAMGLASSLFGSLLAPVLPALEKVVGVVVLLSGLLLLADVNLFKHLPVLQRSQPSGRGRWSGLLLGLSLGLVWIPCVGPMLSSVLAMVAARGKLLPGAALLLVYALGFAAPMLALGYGSQALRQRVRSIASHPLAVRWASGLLLAAFGLVILRRGMLFASL